MGGQQRILHAKSTEIDCLFLIRPRGKIFLSNASLFRARQSWYASPSSNNYKCSSMAKQCISCKREISKGLQECPLCGAPQSYFKLYFKSISITLVISSAIVFYGFKLHHESNQTLSAEIEQKLESQLSLNKNEIEDLKSKLEATLTQLAQASQAIEQNQSQQSADVNQANQLVEQLRSKLNESENELKRQSDRAGWLSRENARLKTQIKQLNEQVASLNSARNTTQPATNQTNPQEDINSGSTPAVADSNTNEENEEKADETPPY